jgi:hypothetical protein
MNPSLLLIPDRYKAAKLYSQIPDSGAGDLDFSRASVATRVNASGLIESVASGVPRLDYTGGGCPSLLLEPQRTNLVTFSEQFDNAAYNKFNLSVTANSLLSPDGTANADKIIENTANNNHFVFRAILPSGVCISYVFAKQGERKNLLLGNASFGVYAVFDLNNGTVVSISGSQLSSPKIESYGNGWYRCSVVNTNNDLRSLAIGIADNLGNVSYTGDGTSGLFIWGAQVEASSYPTSYIPTLGSSVTRLADAASKTGISSLIGQTEGTLFCDVNLDVRGDFIYFAISPDLSSSANYLGIGILDTSIIFQSSVANVLQANISLSNSATGRFKIAGAYKLNDFVMYVNGSQVGVDISGSIPTCSEVGLFQSSTPVSLKYNAATLYTTRLSNAELATLTAL